MLLILTGLVGVFIIGLFIFINSAPSLPPETDSIIADVLESEIPEIITGITGKAKSGEIEIWFESITPADKPKATVLLIMGHGITALAWPEYFFQPLIDSGYQVVRYDNRGLGMSDWMENWDTDDPYALEDMAKDALAVMDALRVEKAHIIGLSMGGMIGQRMAISHADRVLSLTTISSTGYLEDPELPGIPKQFFIDLIKYVLKYGLWQTEKGTIKFFVGMIQLLKGDGDYTIDIKAIAETVLYELRKRRGDFNTKVGVQHTAAIYTSGSRYDELGAINVPTLVIHGKSDPLIPFDHAEKYASMIPGAKTLWLEGMGHDLPQIYAPRIIEEVLRIIQSAMK